MRITFPLSALQQQLSSPHQRGWRKMYRDRGHLWPEGLHKQNVAQQKNVQSVISWPSDGLIRTNRFADDLRESSQGSRTEPLSCELRFGALKIGNCR